MAATEPVPVVTPEQIVARESVQKPRVALAALAAAILVVVAGVLPQSIYSDFPRVYAIESLRDAAGESIGRAGLRTAQILFVDDHALSLLVVAVCQGLSLALIAVLLVFLHDASVVRGATTPRMARMLAIFGGAGGALSAIVLQIGVMIGASDFASSSDHGTAAAHDALRGGLVVAASGVGLFASLALAAAFVLITLGAMRVGLLTRFLGVLGAIVGALILLGPLSGSPTFIVQAFWLVMAGVLLFGRWPGAGVPAAWVDGEARPWPTQQEIREAKDRTRGGGGLTARGPEPVNPAGGGASNGGASPATAARKKRKRR
jgi:hypothetical protein